MKKLLISLLLCCMALFAAPGAAAADKCGDVVIPQPQWESFAEAGSPEMAEGDSLEAVSYYEGSHVPTYYSLTGQGMIDSYYDEDLQTTGYVYSYYAYNLNSYFAKLGSYGFEKTYQESADGAVLYEYVNATTGGVCVVLVDYEYSELIVFAWDDPCLRGDHTPVTMGKRDATCTSEGYTGDVICSVCDRLLERGEVIPKLPHTLEECGVKQEPTEDAEGIMDNCCTVCGTHVETVIPAVGNPFVDVVSKAYYFKAVRWAVQEGIVVGIDETHFVPTGNCTRAQIVTMLWRLAGEPEPEATDCPFTDVPASQYYYKPVQWAVENGITKGVTETTFVPNRTCTRAEALSFLWRYSGEKEATVQENSFEDVPESAYYYGAVLWGVEQGIVLGKSDTSFAPKDICNRAEIVTFIYRYVQAAEADDEQPDEKPDETPDETPDENPGQTPDETPDENPGQTPDETPDEDPSQTPDETPDENPGQTLDETPGGAA